MLRRGLLVLALLSPLFGGCNKSEAQEEQPAPRSLAPLHFTDGTSGLMLTWIGKRGDMHVETLPELVPEDARGFVRVIVADNRDGTTDPIYVTDLGAKDADGSYTGRSLPRSEWEAEIDRRRAEAGGDVDETVRRGDVRPRRGPRPDGDAAPPPRGADTDEPRDPPPKANANGLHVTIYGASWCGPCHQALDHLKHRGVAAVFKDIEQDPGAAREMQAKLDKAGGRRGSIPVIDVGGKIIVGYSESALDRALRDMAGGTAL